jgi:trk system potassium uptake protein
VSASRRWPIESPTLQVVGLALVFLTPGLLIAAAIEWASTTSHDEWALLGTAVVSFGIGTALRGSTRIGADVRAVSVFSIVAWSWIACSFIGALPYVLGSMFTWSTFDDALFESVSGFSCTGSTVLTDVEAHGRGILMWRQMTQWYGGMGMVVLAVTVLPHLGVGGLALMQAEAPGHSSDRLAPRVSETARRLWTIYCGITITVALALWASPGPNLHDAVAHALTTAATGGFSTYNASAGHFDSLLVESILVVGMVLCGMSFALHYRVLSGDRTAWFRSADTRLYLWTIAIATTIVTLLNWAQDLAPFGTSLRDSLFNVVTLTTSTGFGNVRPDGIGDFVLWGAGSQLILLAIMVVGGCVGSTAGGAKGYRVLISWRHVLRELRRLRHPNGIFPIKLGAQVVPETIVASALAFVGLFASIVVIGTLAVAATGAEPTLAASGVISAMSNMGPALGDAGPTGNFTVFDRPARMVLAAIMIIGRLEITAVLLMFASSARTVRDVRRSRVSA